MEIIQIKEREHIKTHKRLVNKLTYFQELINELNTKEIPEQIVISINKDLETINSFSSSNRDLLRLLRKTQTKILKLVEKELKLVTKNHYRNMWMAIGMTVFGIPFGTAFGASLGNMAFIGIGMPIGMAIGIAIGTKKDKEAQKNGNQLNIEVKY